MTEEPQIDPSWSDERLGQEVKALAKYLSGKEIPGFKEVRIMASLYNLVNATYDTNSTLTFELGGYYYNDSEKRNYTITVTHDQP